MKGKKAIVGSCDCCDEPYVVLRRTFYLGTETFACAVCHGYDKDEFDEDLEENGDDKETSLSDQPEILVPGET
jgi:hypothetical protein